MGENRVTKTGFVVTNTLWFVTLLSTVFLFYYLTNSASRSSSFAFTLGFICFLESVFFGYFTFLIFGRARHHISDVMIPLLGTVIGLYIFISTLIVVFYNVLSIFVTSTTAYYSSVMIESLVFLIILGSIIILNEHKKDSDAVIDKKRKSTRDLSGVVQGICDNLSNCKEHLDEHSLDKAESKMKRLNEKFQYCSPFGNEASELETTILNHIETLDKKVQELPDTQKENIDDHIKELEHTATITLQAMERREASLIK